ncbi:hypothetical protein ACI3EY_17055 [Ornithinimicrobium sp. LYQ92]|uniref:hypothetical protein n=1 Tax=Serinicoccus sp. LYQ92 TaxID=3378798 RepID=UPI003853778D
MTDNQDIDGRARDAVAEAAGLVLAQAAGDNDLIDALLKPMAEDRDLPSALNTLRAVLVVAGRAIEADVNYANAQGATSTPAVEQLIEFTKISREGHRPTTDG